MTLRDVIVICGGGVRVGHELEYAGGEVLLACAIAHHVCEHPQRGERETGVVERVQ